MLKSLAVVSLAVVCVAVIAKDVVTDCNDKDVPTLNGPSGQLRINGSITSRKNIVCQWIIDGISTKDLNIYLAFDENLVLSDKDTLHIITEDDKKTPLYSWTGFQWPGVMLFGGDNQKVRVQLNLSDEDIARNWDVMYGTKQNTLQIQNIESSGKFAFSYNKDLDPTKLPEFKVVLKSKSNTNKLLLNLEALDLNGGKVTVDNVYKYSKGTFDNMTTKPLLPDFLLSNDQQINLTFTNLQKLKSDSKGFAVHYDLVNSVCSQYTQCNDTDKDKVIDDVVLPNKEQLQTLSSYRCLNIFEHKDQNTKLLFDLRDFKFINSGDLMTILDGNSPNSTTLAVIESQFLDIYWKDLYLYSSANQMWVMFESPQVVNRENASVFGVQSLSQGGSFHFKSTDKSTPLNINDKSQPPTPLVFTYTADLNKQIAINLDQDTPLPGAPGQLLMEISEENGKNSKPFIQLFSNQKPPDIITSNTNQLKVTFIQTKISFKKSPEIQTVDNGCYYTYLGTSGESFSLNGICSDLCSWLIPKKDNSSGTYILQFSHLNLPKDSDHLEIQMLGQTISTVLDIKGPLTTTTFPDLNLAANETYVLYTRRTKCDKESMNNTELIGVSLVYVDHDLSSFMTTYDTNSNVVIMTSNYPNYYSVGRDQKWNISQPPNKTIEALLTFTDIDLSPGHQLSILNAQDPKNISVISTKDLADSLVTLPLFIKLSSNAITKQPFSGRGFNANLTTFTCGGKVTLLDTDKSKDIETPATLTGISKCIWVVITDQDKTYPNNMTLLEFHVTDDIKNSLRFWDSNSMRDNKLVHFDYFNTTRMSSSTNTLIVEYTLDSKSPKPLKLTFTRTVCTEQCAHTKRCIIPEFACNEVDDCGDYSDERCNGQRPIPKPNITYRTGVNGWVVLLVICPLSIAIGVLGVLYGPRLLSRVGRGRYREFQDFSEVS